MPNSLERAAKTCAEMIEQSKRIVLLSGAGMSTAAGIPDFRGPNGFFATVDLENPERIFEIETFLQDPGLFYTHGAALFDKIRAVQPTVSHRFFAALENAGKMAGIITQNVDALHQRAGSNRVCEIHGGIWEAHCIECQRAYDYETTAAKIEAERIPRCDTCGAAIKPDVVFFGEPVKQLGACQALARDADLFFAVGTSLVVTPAALMPSLTSGRIVVVNKGEVADIYLSKDRIDLYADADIDAFFTQVDTHLNLLSS
ncbi:MAG: Sir2 family NAD-dependent protein deacetylase [Myxococcota bacterium]|nr:Sir2 family NAD-dependent protein deacetylase [Myxococcota bacterium]